MTSRKASNLSQREQQKSAPNNVQAGMTDLESQFVNYSLFPKIYNNFMTSKEFETSRKFPIE